MEDFAAPRGLPGSHSASSIRTIPSRNRNDAHSYKPEITRWDEVAAPVLEYFRQRTKDERLKNTGGTMNEKARKLAEEWGCTPSNTCYWDCVGAAQYEIDKDENISAGA